MSNAPNMEESGSELSPVRKYVDEWLSEIATPSEVELKGPGVFIQEGRLLAEVPLDELRTTKGIAFWLRHLLSKSWFSLRVARQWADALCKFHQ